jgi:hypothetical protein
MTETVIASRMVGGRRFEIDTDPTRLDIALIHHFLAKCSHWARDIPLDTLHRALAHSLVFGIYREGTQVGFARIVTDQATFAYLADGLRRRGGAQRRPRAVVDRDDPGSSAAAGPAALAAGNQERQKSLFALRFCRIITGRLVSGAV